jgi:hypothetical protein
MNQKKQRVCKKCSKAKPLAEFSILRPRYKDIVYTYHHGYCKACKRPWSVVNYYKTNYGVTITTEVAQALLDSKCPQCGAPARPTDAFNKTTKQFREPGLSPCAFCRKLDARKRRYQV